MRDRVWVFYKFFCIQHACMHTVNDKLFYNKVLRVSIFYFRILYCECSPNSCCFSPVKSSLVFAGLVSDTCSFVFERL